MGSSDHLLILAPYLLGRVRRGVVGSSRYAKRLREQIRQAAANSAGRAVLIRGDGADQPAARGGDFDQTKPTAVFQSHPPIVGQLLQFLPLSAEASQAECHRILHHQTPFHGQATLLEGLGVGM